MEFLLAAVEDLGEHPLGGNEDVFHIVYRYLEPEQKYHTEIERIPIAGTFHRKHTHIEVGNQRKIANIGQRCPLRKGTIVS